MIVAETGGGYRFVTQPAHAALAGRFADHWGNDAVATPEPSPAVQLAAHVHDDGWFHRDRRPRLAADGRPEGFTRVPHESWIDMYDRGIDAAIALDPYAGLLVSMHGTGLRKRRYGLSPEWASTPPAYADFVDRQERRQRTIAGRLHEGPAGTITDADVELLESLHETGTPPDGHASRLWRNYALLQAWDALSLAVCETTSSPAYATVGPVPVDESADGDEPITLELAATEDGAIAVEPYPFDLEPLEVSVSARTVEGGGFEDESALLRRYYASPLHEEPIALGGLER